MPTASPRVACTGLRYHVTLTPAQELQVEALFPPHARMEPWEAFKKTLTDLGAEDVVQGPKDGIDFVANGWVVASKVVKAIDAALAPAS